MALSIGMVTIDCTDPQSLARFWVAALDCGAGAVVDDAGRSGRQ